MSAMASQITSFTIVYSAVYSGPDQRKHKSSASLAFVRGIRRWPVNSPHKGPVSNAEMFPFDDVITKSVAMVGWHNLLELRNNMAAVLLQPAISRASSSIKISKFRHKYSAAYYPDYCMGIADDPSLLARCRTGDKPLSKPIITIITNL